MTGRELRFKHPSDSPRRDHPNGGRDEKGNCSAGGVIGLRSSARRAEMALVQGQKTLVELRDDRGLDRSRRRNDANGSETRSAGRKSVVWAATWPASGVWNEHCARCAFTGRPLSLQEMEAESLLDSVHRDRRGPAYRRGPVELTRLPAELQANGIHARELVKREGTSVERAFGRLQPEKGVQAVAEREWGFHSGPATTWSGGLAGTRFSIVKMAKDFATAKMAALERCVLYGRARCTVAVTPILGA